MKYIKIATPIEAIQWTGANFKQIVDFMSDNRPIVNAQNELIIQTANGEMHAPIGSYIAQGTLGDFYPVEKEAFEQSYMPFKEPKTFLVDCMYCENKLKVVAPEVFYDCIHNKYMYGTTCPNCKKRVEWDVNS